MLYEVITEIDKQTKRLEQLAAKMETDSTTRYTWVQKSLEGQDGKNREERDRLRGEVNSVITSYSIHYTKLYDQVSSARCLSAVRGWLRFLRQEKILDHNPAGNIAAARRGTRSYNFV